MKIRRKSQLLAALLVFTLLAAGCTASQLRKASVMVRDFGVTLDKVQDGFIAAHQDGFIPDAEHQQIQLWFVELAKDGKEAVSAIRDLHSKPGALAALDRMLASTDKLLNQGLLHVNNPAKRAELSGLVLSLRGLIVTAQALLA